MKSNNSWNLLLSGRKKQKSPQKNQFFARCMTLTIMACIALSGVGQAWEIKIDQQPDPVIACKGEPVTVTLTASYTGDKPNAHDECEVGEATYKWTGDSTANTATATITKTFNEVGEKTISATVEVSFKDGLGCGQNDTKTEPKTITVCVVEPGTVPVGRPIASPEVINENPPPGWNYVGPIPADRPPTFGGTRPLGIRDVDIETYFDCESRKWRCKVVRVKASCKYYVRRNSRQEATIDQITEANHCQMLNDLRARTYFQWIVLDAILAHEQVHIDQWMRIANRHFLTMKESIEALSVAPHCGQVTKESSRTTIMAMAEYNAAIQTANDDAAEDWAPIEAQHTQPSHAGPFAAAELAASGSIINAINAQIQQGILSPCPGGAIARVENRRIVKLLDAFDANVRN